MYEYKTAEMILAELLLEVRDDVDKREGSLVHDMLAASAASNETIYVEMDTMLALAFPDTSAGLWLERITRAMGVFRKQAEKAHGQVMLSYSGDITVPAGERVIADSVDGPIYFITLADAVISNNAVTVDAEAVEGGANGNVSAGAIAAFAEGSDFGGVVTVTNASAFSGGVDIESDESLLERYYTRVRKPATSGNANQYEQWALEIAGISKARVYPLWNGPGTLKIVLVSTEGRAPSAEKVQEVTDYIESVRPFGASVSYVPCVEKPININATLTLQPGADIEAIKTAYSAALRELFANEAFTSNTVRYSRLASLTLDQEGVIDWADLTVNGGTANVVLGADEVAVVGEVTFIGA